MLSMNTAIDTLVPHVAGFVNSGVMGEHQEKIELAGIYLHRGRFLTSAYFILMVIVQYYMRLSWPYFTSYMPNTNLNLFAISA